MLNSNYVKSKVLDLNCWNLCQSYPVRQENTTSCSSRFRSFQTINTNIQIIRTVEDFWCSKCNETFHCSVSIKKSSGRVRTKSWLVWIDGHWADNIFRFKVLRIESALLLWQNSRFKERQWVLSHNSSNGVLNYVSKRYAVFLASMCEPRSREFI